MVFVESPMLTSTPDLDPETWSVLNKVHEEQNMELPPVWHLAAIYTLKDLSKEIIDICMDKWVPSELLEVCDDVKRSHAALSEATKAKVDINDYQRVLMAWRYNSFGHHTESDGLVMYNRISMMSHSCRSTCCWHYGENDTFILRARINIEVGDELSISYIGDDDLLQKNIVAPFWVRSFKIVL